MDVRGGLSRSEVMRGVSAADLDAVSLLAQERVFEAGAAIVREDEEAKELFLIVDGTAAVEVRWPDGAGTFQEIGRLKRGDLVGEIAFVDRLLRSASVRASTRVQAVALPFEDVRRLMEERPVLGYRVMSNIARLLAATMRAHNLKLRNVLATLLH